ncbi:hypothetical protein LTR36_000674 [Oleoguttula mirabilis]|uniref:Uncharacterized protein n=1 Tax=Oleoguttula mirabilis TaxID=1507867 RepID=A0AAV9JQK0_9PEZI|nr:hypothetical protein LTR36_000674 [Oleoguttula mirabilis]
MPSGQNTKPMLATAGPTTDDGKGDKDKLAVAYPTEEQMSEKHGGEERFTQTVVPKGSLKNKDDWLEFEANRKGLMEAEFVERVQALYEECVKTGK